MSFRTLRAGILKSRQAFGVYREGSLYHYSLTTPLCHPEPHCAVVGFCVSNGSPAANVTFVTEILRLRTGVLKNRQVFGVR